MIKNIFTSLLILSQIFAGYSFAGLSESDKSSVQSQRNILLNSGFESGTSYWTASGGATATTNSTAKGTGALGYDWDSNSASQTLTSSSVTIPAGLQGKNGILSCQIKTVSGTATHTIGLWDGTTLSSTQTITSSTTSFAETKINFVFPSSGTAAIRISSVSSNESEIYVDDCKLSLADNIGTVAQAYLVGTATVTGCSTNWSVTSTTFAAFGAQTGCSYAVTGNAKPPSTNIPGFKFDSLPAGDYVIEYEGQIQAANAAVVGFYQFTDGTNTAREISQVNTNGGYLGVPSARQTISYTSPQSNVTFQMFAKTASSNTNIYGTTANPGTFRLWYFPSASQQAVSSAQADYDWTSYTPTFTGFGTVSSIECQHSRVTSNLLLRCKFVSGTSTAVEARVSLPNSLTVADTSKVPSLQIAGNGAKSGISGSDFGVRLPLILNGTSYVTVGRQTSSTAAFLSGNGSDIISSGETMQLNATIPIQGWSSNQRAPTLVGSVTNDSASAIKTIFANVTNNGSVCTLVTNKGFTSVSRSSSGRCSFVYSGFSEAPTCKVTNYGTGDRGASTNTPTTTVVDSFTLSGASLSDEPFGIECIGAR